MPGGEQGLCFHETISKINRHCLRWLFDTRLRRSLQLQDNDTSMDLRNISVPRYIERYRGRPNLLNFYCAMRIHASVRNFLRLGSVVGSVDW